jgi:hypothetical protein
VKGRADAVLVGGQVKFERNGSAHH